MRRGTGAVVGGALHAHYVGAHGHLSLHLFVGKQTANQQKMNTGQETKTENKKDNNRSITSLSDLNKPVVTHF